MKVVLLHDWLTGFRGGERVLEAFCEMFPDAPIYTLLHIPNSTSPIIENGRKIHTSFLNKIPGIAKHYRKFLPIFPLAVERLKIKEKDIDLIISSSHCVIKGLSREQGRKKARHISYIHSPMRYIYDQFDVYFGKDAPFAQKMAAKFFRKYLQSWDIKSNRNVDLMVANSFFVRQRIQKYYERDAKVVHPFVDLKDFREVQKRAPIKEDFYLMVTAFAPNKRVDLAISAFNRIGKTLKIIGSGQQEKFLKEMAHENIHFLGNVDRENVISLMARAKGFIFPGVEDFGITPLESLAAGTPVIAFKKGGVLETLNEDVACFFDDQEVSSLIRAVNLFQNKKFKRENLQIHALNFSKERFIQNIQKTF